MSATPKQRDFIEALFTQKGVDEETRAKTRLLMNREDAKTRQHISPIIDGLLALPNASTAKPLPAPAAGAEPVPGKGLINSLLRAADVRVAKYAVPTGELPSSLQRYASHNSHLHVEVGEFKETRYLRILHGAPGSFSRSKFASSAEQRLMIDVLAPQQLRYTQIFGDTYSCCGVCGAELTDDTSKALKLGPVCRTRFGL